MNEEWQTHQGWIAYFDILGFKEIINNEANSLTLEMFKDATSKIIKSLRKNVSYFKEEDVDYLFYADTFIIYSKTEKMSGYPGIISVSKNFIRGCIYEEIAIQGAISYGEIVFGHNNRILMGKAFLESYNYCESQNWLGLILSPSVSKKLEDIKLCPREHSFIHEDIPMKSPPDKRLFAYSFTDNIRDKNGRPQYPDTLLQILEQMKCGAPEKDMVKYANTIAFIKKHHTEHSS